MRELAIMESVVDAVTERVGDAKVVRVLLEIGKLSGASREFSSISDRARCSRVSSAR